MVMFGDLINKFLTENNFRCIVIARLSLISIVCWCWLCVSGMYSISFFVVIDSVFLCLLVFTLCLWQLDEVLCVFDSWIRCCIYSVFLCLLVLTLCVWYFLCVSFFVGIDSVCLWQLDEVLSERRQEIKQQQQKELSRIQEEHATRLRNIRQEYENKVRGGYHCYI